MDVVDQIARTWAADFSVGLITKLKATKRWLEQEAILLDPRLSSALAWLENNR